MYALQFTIIEVVCLKFFYHKKFSIFIAEFGYAITPTNLLIITRFYFCKLFYIRSFMEDY